MISIHAPLTGCDTHLRQFVRTPFISIHAPLTGCDVGYRPSVRAAFYFNPRTPHGVRRQRCGSSIPHGQFQSTHPSRGATLSASPLILPPIFQSTHPSRGATRPGFSPGRIILISIHAPLTGCDSGRLSSMSRFTDFNPRTPHGVRQLFVSVKIWYPNFNPRTPHGVRRSNVRTICATWSISIHAPLTGCDYASSFCVISVHDFNPRTPHGVRPRFVYNNGPPGEFQSTHPSRGATRCLSSGGTRSPISIHAPLTGCDSLAFVTCSILSNFNPRTPHGVRHLANTLAYALKNFNPRTPHGVRHIGVTTTQKMMRISIHAPLTGCDHFCPWKTEFCIIISIHAPLTGCDCLKHLRIAAQVGFQSTHPSRGATWAMTFLARKSTNFNPRTPHGVRLRDTWPFLRHGYFNPRTPHGVRPRETGLLL